MRRSLPVLDEEIDRRVAEIRADRAWPCARGCDACCRSLSRPPELSEAEWARISAVLDERARRAAMRRSIERSPRVCPFLDEGAGECTIYEVRPIACRTYGYYVERGSGLWCEEIERAVEDHGLGDGVIFGNQEGITSSLGPTRPLTEWLATEERDARAQTAPGR